MINVVRYLPRPPPPHPTQQLTMVNLRRKSDNPMSAALGPLGCLSHGAQNINKQLIRGGFCQSIGLIQQFVCLTYKRFGSSED